MSTGQISKHNPTPLSTRIANIAAHLGWTDNSYYGDTDYGLGQEFEQGDYLIRLDWDADGRQGVSDVLRSVRVLDKTTKPVITDVNVLVNRHDRFSQPHMRSFAISALTDYAEERTE